MGRSYLHNQYELAEQNIVHFNLK